MPAAADLADLQASKQAQLQQRRASSKKSNSLRTSSAAAAVHEDLGLSAAAEPPNNADSEAVRLRLLALEEQNRSLVDENGRMAKLVNEKDFELKRLKKKINTSEIDGVESGGAGLTNDVAAAKIIELSRRLRETCAELHKEQSVGQQLRRDLADRDQELSVLHSELSSVSTLKLSQTAKKGAKQRQQAAGAETDQAGATREKLEATTAKMLELRAQLESTKLELKKTQKALQSEVGDGVSVHDIISGKSAGGWRGRQQKIIELQHKLQDMKEATSLLSSAPPSTAGVSGTGRRRSSSFDPLEEEMMGLNPNLGGSGNAGGGGVGERNKAHIRQLERRRQEEVEKMRADVRHLQSENSKLHQGLDSHKARNTTLSSEVKSLKTQVGALKEKSAHDDELVSALMAELAGVRTELEKARQAAEEAAGCPQPVKLTAAQQQVERAIVDQLKQLVAEKEARIRSLDHELQVTRIQLQNATESSESTAAATLPLQSPSPSKLRQPNVIGSRPTTTNSMRPPASQVDNSEQLQELTLKVNELNTLLSASNVERDKLREFCSVLQKRLDASVEERAKTDKELSHVRKRSVLLEKQLESSLSNHGQGSRKGGATSSSTVSLRDSRAAAAAGSGLTSAADMEEAGVKAELLQEEVALLRANLDTIMKARDEDFALYRTMIEETKGVFLTALRQFKHSHSPPSDSGVS